MVFSMLRLTRGFPMLRHGPMVRHINTHGAPSTYARRRATEIQATSSFTKLYTNRFSQEPPPNPAITQILNMRDTARQKRDFALSDKLRDELRFEMGIGVDDKVRWWWHLAGAEAAPGAPGAPGAPDTNQTNSQRISLHNFPERTPEEKHNDRQHRTKVEFWKKKLWKMEFSPIPPSASASTRKHLESNIAAIQTDPKFAELQSGILELMKVSELSERAL